MSALHSSCSLVLADDSTAYRTALVSALLRDPTISILGDVSDGEAAVGAVGRTRPDVALLDVMMPKLDGVEAARRITRGYGVPVLLMSPLARIPEQRPDLSSLPPHLVELVDKPVLVGAAGPANIAALIGRMKALARIGHSNPPREPERRPPPTRCALVVIAASTGGMEALRTVLGRLPASFPPVVIAQHLDPVLGAQFAGLLQSATGQTVVTVDAAVQLQPGRIHVAAPFQHVIVRSGRVASRPAQAGELAPSADQLFSSAAASYGKRAVGIVLTGMGRDGASGLRELREASGWTIAQDEASALVGGMPRAAIDKGACCEVLPLNRIGERLSRLALDNGGLP